MKKVISILMVALLALTFNSCKKEEKATPECETKGIGYIIFTNTSDDPYTIYNGAVYFTEVAANSSAKAEAAPGTYVLKAKQKSGYVLYPTEKTFTQTVVTCQEYVITFPAK